jgi:Txe/YoeB family toxin of Txe-Axe toxin-antitoxin module
MKLEFKSTSLDDLKYWVNSDRKKALRILELIDDIQEHPLTKLRGNNKLNNL